MPTSTYPQCTSGSRGSNKHHTTLTCHSYATNQSNKKEFPAFCQSTQTEVARGGRVYLYISVNWAKNPTVTSDHMTLAATVITTCHRARTIVAAERSFCWVSLPVLVSRAAVLRLPVSVSVPASVAVPRPTSVAPPPGGKHENHTSKPCQQRGFTDPLTRRLTKEIFGRVKYLFGWVQNFN